jgi:hypothetical protein
MKAGNTIFQQTRRRFLGMFGAFVTLLALPVWGSRESRLSRHEASFYRKGRQHDC